MEIAMGIYDAPQIQQQPTLYLNPFKSNIDVFKAKFRFEVEEKKIQRLPIRFLGICAISLVPNQIDIKEIPHRFIEFFILQSQSHERTSVWSVSRCSSGKSV